VGTRLLSESDFNSTILTPGYCALTSSENARVDSVWWQIGKKTARPEMRAASTKPATSRALL
jgi:hypothetical protein